MKPCGIARNRIADRLLKWWRIRFSRSLTTRFRAPPGGLRVCESLFDEAKAGDRYPLPAATASTRWGRRSSPPLVALVPDVYVGRTTMLSHP